MNHYTYRAEWSSERGEYVGRCLELPWLSQWAPTMQEAIAGVERAVDEHLAERGERLRACTTAVSADLAILTDEPDRTWVSYA